MKRIVILFIMIFSCKNYLLCFEFGTQGLITGQINSLTSTTYSRFPLKFYEDRQDYINGGLTFTYSNITWSTIPRVWITVELINPPSPTNVYAAVVSSNSPTSTIVLVYKISNGGTVVEASSGEVKVSIFAIENIY
jgi:hypothetical protein